MPPKPDGEAEALHITLLRKQLREACEGDERKLFVLLDAARLGGLAVLLNELRVPHACLYDGEAARKYMRQAPYLASVALHSDFLAWFIVHSPALEAALFMAAAAEPMALREHFRRFLLVKNTEGKDCYFRFYDPRVLEPYLRCSRPPEVARFHGPVSVFLARNPKAEPTAPRLLEWKRPALPAEAAPGEAGRLVIRPEQEAVFSADVAARYERSCIDYLRGRHGPRLSKSSDEELKVFIRDARSYGKQAGFVSGEDVTLLAEAILLKATPVQVTTVSRRPPEERSQALEELRDQLMKEAYS